MSGFKNFILRGNLIELAVAFIIGGAFATVVKAFTDLLVEVIGRATGGSDFNLDDWSVGGLLKFGPFLTAVVAFLILAAVVYFGIVKPYELAKERMFPKEPDAETIDPNTELLKEIRDELRAGRGTA
jgi:large conductance mechanosensitive channel